MTTTAPAIVPPFTLNARSADHRSSRIGSGSGTAPFGIATTTVIPSKAESSRPGRNDASEPSLDARAHGSVEPSYPWKHVTRWIVAGAVTVTRARSIGACHSSPIAFQNSSS